MRRTRRRLPRASGDSPGLHPRTGEPIAFAPRKWGFTRKPDHQFRPGGVCPAQVGIHRHSCRCVPTVRCLPRASGDSPSFMPMRPDGTMFAPRKWGFTEPSEPAWRRGSVCPAQVGIHQARHRSGLLSACLPRASGDSPDEAETGPRSGLFAPRKWGFTLAPWLRLASSQVCPAQVGIHRVKCC